jgi:hypothetical protein
MHSSSLLWYAAVAIALALAMIFVTACGNDDDDDSADNATAPAATSTGGASAAPSATTSSAPTSATSPEATTGTGTGDAGEIATCIQGSMSEDIVMDLREGDSASAQEVYETCLETALPPALVTQLEPIVEQAGECGVTAAQGLSDADVTALESGDEAVITRVTEETLACVSEEFGVELS